jgi:hypothetical protein
MTLEDISGLFGDPVELSFEQALREEHEGGQTQKNTMEHLEVASNKAD